MLNIFLVKYCNTFNFSCPIVCATIGKLGKKPLKNIPKVFISNLHKKDREDCKRRVKRKRIKGLKRKLSNTDGNMRDNVTRYTYILWRYATIDTSNE